MAWKCQGRRYPMECHHCQDSSYLGKSFRRSFGLLSIPECKHKDDPFLYPDEVVKVQSVVNDVKILTNTEWDQLVLKINAIGSAEDVAQASSIIDGMKACACKGRYANMQYRLFDKYK